MSAPPRPTIYQIGTVRDDGVRIVAAGWGLGLCVARCPCHRHPRSRALSIYQDNAGSRLGLISHYPGGCDCCEPWPVDELAAIARDLQAIADLEVAS